MSGPPYPRYAPGFAPGSNAIGTFQIGISPIGTLTPYDEWASVISQYANSSKLTALITRFNAALDQTQNMESLYDLVWNIATAAGWGLDVWGRIVDVPRTLHLPGSATYLGFQEAGGSWTGFNQGGFYSGQAISDNYDLSDDRLPPADPREGGDEHLRRIDSSNQRDPAASCFRSAVPPTSSTTKT
jgi:hypothetical protein